MTLFYPMATFDGNTDNFHTLTTYDSQFTIDDCLSVIEMWLSLGYKIDNCWIQEYAGQFLIEDIPVKIVDGKAMIDD